MIRRALLTADRWLTGASLALACALLAIVSGLGTWQVLARFIFEEPSTWTEEAMRRLLIWMVMFGVVVAFRRGAQVSVDLMLARGRGAWRRVVQAIVTLLIAFAFSISIAVAIGGSAMLGLAIFEPGELILVPKEMFTAIDKFPLAAIPFLSLAGNLMETGGISRRPVAFAKSIVGGVQGGLPMTCVLTRMISAAVSGSSVATTFAIGSILIRPWCSTATRRTTPPHCRPPAPSSASSSRRRSR